MAIYFNRFFVWFGVALLIFASALYVSKFRLMPESLRRFTVYLVCLLILDCIAKYHAWFKMDNRHLLHIFNYVELATLTWYFLSFKKGLAYTLTLVSAIAVGLVLLTGNLFLYTLQEYNVVGFMALKIFIIVLSATEVYLYHFHERKHWYHLNVGLLLSATVTSSIFTFANAIFVLDWEVQRILWIFNAAMFCLSLILISYELLKPGKTWKLKP